MNSYSSLSYEFISYVNDMNSYSSFIHHMNLYTLVNPYYTDNVTNGIVYS
jgi:hypothetical protein